jgi:hypothetical protein
MDPDIKKLIDSTTIVKVDDNVSRQTIFGDEYFVSRFQEDQGQQVNLSDFEDNWNNKWKSFGNNWNEERQNYRFLYDSFKLFYFSFEQLRFNKVECINEAFGNRLKMLHLNELTGVSLYGMYHHGKKCIDLLKVLKLIDENHNDWEFLTKFSETRNKLIEHNYNPHGLNLQIDPAIWSLASTDSRLEIHIHKPDTERAFDVYVDYYEDYYQLEKIITDIIKKF